MEKTFSTFITDLPGRVKPSKREIQSRDDHSMRHIIFRPEMTPQEIKPLEEEAMNAAFGVEGGEVKMVSFLG